VPTPKEYRARDGSVTWRVRLRAHGRNTSETFTTKRAAEQFCKQVDAIGSEAAIAYRARVDHASSDYVPTLAEWLTRHIEELTGVTERTRLDYLSMAKRTWLPLIGDVPVDGISRAVVSRTVNALEAQGLAAKSIANAHALLSSVLTSAVLAGDIQSNPCVKIRLPRAREAERHGERFLTWDEYERLISHVPDERKPLVAFMFGTGMRWSEVTALQVRDVIANGRPPHVRVTKAWKRTPGKGVEIGPPKSPKSRRTVLPSSAALDLITPLLDRDPDALLFQTGRGRPIHHANFRIRVWVPACKAAGLTPLPRIHDARHTHASWLLEMCATLEQVQDQLGHESILTTRKIYGQLQPAMQSSLYDAASRAMQPRALN
jgi:integrase